MGIFQKKYYPMIILSVKVGFLKNLYYPVTTLHKNPIPKESSSNSVSDQFDQIAITSISVPELDTSYIKQSRSVVGRPTRVSN